LAADDTLFVWNHSESAQLNPDTSRTFAIAESDAAAHHRTRTRDVVHLDGDTTNRSQGMVSSNGSGSNESAAAGFFSGAVAAAIHIRLSRGDVPFGVSFLSSTRKRTSM